MTAALGLERDVGCYLVEAPHALQRSVSLFLDGEPGRTQAVCKSVRQLPRRGQPTCHSLVFSLCFLQVMLGLQSAWLHKSLSNSRAEFLPQLWQSVLLKTSAKHRSFEGTEGMLSRTGHSWCWKRRGFSCSPPPTPPQAIRDSHYQRKNDRNMECGGSGSHRLATSFTACVQQLAPPRQEPRLE